MYRKWLEQMCSDTCGAEFHAYRNAADRYDEYQAIKQLEEPGTRGEYLDAAKAIVTKDRESQYGSPENNFDAIGRLWTEYILISTGESTVLSARDVAIMMALMKVARIATGVQKADSWVDAIGYMACGAEIAT